MLPRSAEEHAKEEHGMDLLVEVCQEQRRQLAGNSPFSRRCCCVRPMRLRAMGKVLLAAKDVIIDHLKYKVKTLEEALAERSASAATDSADKLGQTSNRYRRQYSPSHSKDAYL